MILCRVASAFERKAAKEVGVPVLDVKILVVQTEWQMLDALRDIERKKVIKDVIS